MIDIKKSLYTYMRNAPGSFVGFFDLVSEVLGELGDRWLEHSETNNDEASKDWANVFLEASKTIKNVSQSLDKIRAEHDKLEVEKNSTDPSVLIQNFKDKVMKEIKNGR